MMNIVRKIAQLLLDWRFPEHTFEYVFRKEKKELSRGIRRLIERNADRRAWVSFLREESQTEVGREVRLFLLNRVTHEDFQSIRQLHHFLRIDASSDEILSHMNKMRMKQADGADA